MDGVEFSDGKDESALRTIGEVSKALAIKPHVLRYWEEQFPMLKPLKRSGSRRYYRREDIELLGRIDTLVNRQGYTIKGARQAIENDAGQHDRKAPESESSYHAGPERQNEREESREAQAAPAQANLGETIARLKAIRADLAAAVAR